MNAPSFNPSTLDSKLLTERRIFVLTWVFILTAPAVLVMADLHWRAGFDFLKFIHLVFFALLFSLVGFGAVQASVGFWIRRRGGDPCSIHRSLENSDREGSTPIGARTAVVMPICNEDVKRVMEGLRFAYESVATNGRLRHCDFFILSDSSNPNHWIEEEAAWLAMTQRLGASGRIYYRKRPIGINKKAGNIADFCRRWGKHYRYMVVLDADSIMTGDAIVNLVTLMERNPGVGIIQGVPLLINGETILARLQQFASRLYGPVFATGLNYWQLSEGNYWGHNAIIRLAPFIKHCALPELPGDGPFGGRIMSHDYVEAALMRRAGWQVWLAPELSGNYEECPANVIDFAKRDRRWLQGNLQHAKLVIARGFHPVNRVHFSLGILSYLSSPLWLVMLVLSAIIASRITPGEPAAHVNSFATYLHWSERTQALSLFGFTMALLFVPKIIALLDLKTSPKEVAAFGGWAKIGLSVMLETLFFTLLAPILMIFHTKFVILTLARRSVTWGSQRRGREGASAWGEACAEHWGHSLIGMAAAFIVFKINPMLAAWMSPVLGGLILSIPLSFITGSFEIGSSFKRFGVFMTPEESIPGDELQALNSKLAALAPAVVPTVLGDDYGLLQAVVDPYVNAAHVALLRERDGPTQASEERFVPLRQKLLREGPAALNGRDKIALLMDIDSMIALHDELWTSPASRLSDWWNAAMNHYNVLSRPPETAFNRAA